MCGAIIIKATFVVMALKELQDQACLVGSTLKMGDIRKAAALKDKIKRCTMLKRTITQCERF